MIESFVDLSYRGLALGRRIKLTAVRPTTGYLELPMPMPVGTHVSIVTDDGIALDAVVTGIHEQVGGSDRMPGMIVKPMLEGEAEASWWQARVALPDDAPAASARTRPLTVRPRSKTTPQPIAVPVQVESPPPELPPSDPAPADVAPPPVAEDNRTVIMPALDQEMLAKVSASEGEVERLTRTTGEHEVIDDGLHTTVMEAVDPSALGFDVTASGSFRAAHPGEASEDAEKTDAAEAPGVGDSQPTSTSTQPGGKTRRKRR
ncbi:MAG TPA: hypothetical protein VK427_24880 [Kofleriaceae bacterium]|nr:hypothetical protein [Kofleriaceae bacterium]